MPFNPFNSLTGKNATTLFEIRLDDDFIIFRGNEHEAAGQLLKGVVVLCLPSSLKVEDVHLRLTGTLRLAWSDSRMTPSGVSTTRVDRTRVIFNHRWDPFVGPPAGSSSKSITLPAGNYEWPFELLLPGSTAESVEGLPETHLTYKLKATIARGKLAYDLHAHKHLRIVRTLEPAALEFLHAMSVENVWVNKIEYSIATPQKAVVFGGTIPLEMRFTPLLKGLEMGDITVKLVEIHEFIAQAPGTMLREYRYERDISKSTFTVSREEHWQDVIEETEQEGWVVKAPFVLPKRLRDCVQDVNVLGIKIRHKLRLNVALKNPDGHVSELRATLPVTIFISPNMLLDDQGNLVRQPAGTAMAEDVAAIAPPGYGEHILDQLYDDVDVGGFQSPPLQSGVNSPFYSQSRTGSADNLPSILGGAHAGVAPAALRSMLQNVAAPSGSAATASGFDQSNQNYSFNSADSTQLSRRPSGEDGDSTHSSGTTRAGIPSGMTSGYHTPEHIDYPLEALSKVPSYATAVKAPARTLHMACGSAPPDYQVAVNMSAPASPSHSESDPMGAATAGPMETIHEVASATTDDERRRRRSGSSVRSGHSNESVGRGHAATAPLPEDGQRRSGSPSRTRASSLGMGFLHSHLHLYDSEERRRLHLVQARE